jgi:quercetin dioxygenase-like cupin family protein
VIGPDNGEIRKSEGEGMKLVRLYSGGDGQSHFEDLVASAESMLFSKMQAATGILFKNDPSPHILDWHPAPRRQYCVTLAGFVEIRVGDGTAKTFAPGDVFLAEDLTGQGHIAVPSADWTRVFVTLD